MKKMLLILALTSVSLVFSQERVNREKPVISKPISILSVAKGWYYEESEGEWKGAKNHISRIDDFKNFIFYKLSYKGDNLLYLKKNRNNTVFKYPKIFEGASVINMRTDYVLNLSDYKKSVSTFDEQEGTLEIPVIRFNDYMRDNFKLEVDPDTENKDIKYYLGIKYRLYPDKKLARFLIYAKRDFTSTKYDPISIEGLSETNEFTDRDVLKEIQGGDIFNKFYYECPLDEFLNFIKAPLTL